MTTLSWAMRLGVRVGSGLLIAAAIAIALTVPAPACDARCHDQTARSATLEFNCFLIPKSVGQPIGQNAR